MPAIDKDGDKPKFGKNNSSLTHLDHDHCKRENIRFLAVCPRVVQNFGRSPPRSMPPVIANASNRIEVLSDRRKAKIRDSCMVIGIDEDIRLSACHC